MSQVKDPKLAPSGKMKMAWAREHMPVLAKITRRLVSQKTFKGYKIGTCLHLEAKTAVLAESIHQAGAEVAITGSNPLSTQDDVAAALSETGVHVYAWHGVTEAEHKQNLNRVLDLQPDILIDDGAELSILAHLKGGRLLRNIIGACEETTTGVMRLRAMEQQGKLRFPVIAVNDALTKYLGRNVVVAGYGWVGRGVAERARGMGSKVIVTEVNPVRALEALMEGFDVMPMSEAAEKGDLFITATGDTDVITSSHMLKMKDKTILCNVGHYDVEVKVRDLERIAVRQKKVRPEVVEYTLPSRKRLYLLSEGRLVNLAAADGHPAEVMDMSFADQALSAEYLSKNKGKLPPKVVKVPKELDFEVARQRLEAFGCKIDKLSRLQQKYIHSWQA